MAGPCTRCNACETSTNNSNTPNLIPAIFCTFIPTPAQVLAITLAAASILDPLARYIDKDLKRTTKLAQTYLSKTKNMANSRQIPYYANSL